ncbi:MAG: TrmH family RNA methyltransferase [Chitinophagaceae bacterium]
MLSKAQIKYIHSLRLKKYRQKYCRFFAEGVKVVDELLKEHFIRIDTLFATEEWFEGKQQVSELHPETKIQVISEQELKQLSNLDTPQQVFAICTIPTTTNFPKLSGHISLALETIQDPGNLGTIIRIADWFGIENVICSPDCADTFSPKTIQATMGSIARVRITEIRLEKIGERIENIPVFATTLRGKDIRTFSPVKEGIILIGNEGHGLSEKAIQMATHCITIPRTGKAESLNAAVAAGIICSQLLLL